MGISLLLNCFLVCLLIILVILFIKQLVYITINKESFIEVLFKRYSRSKELTERFIHKNATNDVFITVLYHCIKSVDVISEQIKCIIQVLENKVVANQKFEIIMFVNQAYAEIDKLEMLCSLFPNCILSLEESSRILTFINGSLRACGSYIIESNLISSLLDTIPIEEEEYLYLIEPDVCSPPFLFKSSNFLIPTGVSKKTFMKLFAQLRQTDDSIAAEIKILSKENGITPIITKQKFDEKEFPFSRIIFCTIKTCLVKYFYSNGIWNSSKPNIEESCDNKLNSKKVKDE